MTTLALYTIQVRKHGVLLDVLTRIWRNIVRLISLYHLQRLEKYQETKARNNLKLTSDKNNFPLYSVCIHKEFRIWNS